MFALPHLFGIGSLAQMVERWRPTAPWERLVSAQSMALLRPHQQMGAPRLQAARVGWWMTKTVAAEGRPYALLKKYPEQHPEVIAAQQAVEDLKQVKPSLTVE